MSQVIQGSAIKVMMGNKLMGIFTRVSLGVNYEATPIFTLGRFNPQEILVTSQDAIRINASGWRIFDQTSSLGIGFPKLQDILNAPDTSFSLVDRVSGVAIATVIGVRLLSFDSTVAARSPTEVNVSFMGVSLSDETGPSFDSGTGDSAPSTF